MDKNRILKYEVNFITADKLYRSSIIEEIKTEFDLVRMCQAMIKPFGLDARRTLDRFIALSLRKLLCDDESLLKRVCEGFKMPPLVGDPFYCDGENNEMRIHEIHPDILIKPQAEWILLGDWLKEKIAWIDKEIDDIPEAYEDRFFHMISDKIGNESFVNLFVEEEIEENGTQKKIWRLKEYEKNKEKVYNILKKKGYYELTIRTLIKYIADKKGAHLEAVKSHWIGMANTGKNWEHSAISVFATHMIYAATKQIKELSDYLEINPMIECL